MHSFVLEMIALDPPPVLHSTKLRRGAYRRARITKMKCQLPGIEQLPSEMLYRIFELGAEIEDDNLRGHSQFTILPVSLKFHTSYNRVRGSVCSVKEIRSYSLVNREWYIVAHTLVAKVVKMAFPEIQAFQKRITRRVYPFSVTNKVSHTIGFWIRRLAVEMPESKSISEDATAYIEDVVELVKSCPRLQCLRIKLGPDPSRLDPKRVDT
ncbi:hypothetical protein SCHPADRAFT_897568, partial [Schizopora paradoxa]